MAIRRPSAKKGLITNDHSKGGTRWVSVLDPASLRVTVLEPFEHLVLMMCDGTRDAELISLLVGEERELVDRVLARLEQAKLIEEHEIDVHAIEACLELPTGEIDSGDTPFDGGEAEPLPPGLEPTVAWVVADEDSFG